MYAVIFFRKSISNKKILIFLAKWSKIIVKVRDPFLVHFMSLNKVCTHKATNGTHRAKVWDHRVPTHLSTYCVLVVGWINILAL